MSCWERRQKPALRLSQSVVGCLLCASSVLLAQDLVPSVQPAPAPNPNPSPNPAPVAAAVEVKKEGVSKFGKISVIGSDQNTRGGISSVAESMRVSLNNLCGEAGRKMQLPMFIYLHGAVGDTEQDRSVVSRIEQLHGQYQLKLYIHLAKGVNHKLLRYHLMEMFLYERGLGADQAVADGERVLVKPWLIVGMLEAIDIKSGRADKRIYQTEMPYFEIVPLQKVFDASEQEWRDMDGRKPLAFRAISGAMVNSLLRQPDGRPGMAAYLAAVATFKGESENLMRQHFPGMNKSRNSLEKWVNLEMLELGTARMTQVHSMLETEKRLDNVLKLRYKNKEGEAVSVGIDGYADVMKLKPAERFEAVAGARAELERLSYRCFPTFRPMIAEYEMILREVILGKDKDINTRLQKLQDVRMKMTESGKRVRDYLDWYYITQSNEVSGDFEKYRDLQKALEKEKLRLPVDNATETYLDQVQRIFVGGASGRRKR